MCSSPGFNHQNRNQRKTSVPFLFFLFPLQHFWLKKVHFLRWFIQNWEEIESLKNDKSPGIVLEKSWNSVFPFLYRKPCGNHMPWLICVLEDKLQNIRSGAINVHIVLVFIMKINVSHNLTFRSDITPCLKIDKPLVAYILMSHDMRFPTLWNVLFQALKMYLNCLMHPCTLLKHVQFVNNVLMYIVLL